MLTATQTPRVTRSRSCPPRSPTPPPAPSLKRTHSSNDLTAALHLIGLGDNAGSPADLKSPPTTALSHDIPSLVAAGQKKDNPPIMSATRPRHARKFSLQKRKKSLPGLLDKLERPSIKNKRARSCDGIDRGRSGSGSYTVQALTLAFFYIVDKAIVTSSSLTGAASTIMEEVASTSTSDSQPASLPVSPSHIPRSPSCIGLLEADDSLPSGYRSLGAISAVVSPTTSHSQDPASMFLSQAQKLDRRLRRYVMKS
ncbi:hypothetical protein P389DRAFT_192315 [Cystobasidium minutum MCA 4210]|uniref:uncharacterized protein n=1 Tax=Cystobasidium minutum MCA 4210 TaxID=1397322 RepID=UPI0034CD39D3|eukprot:jgi/Rhomi1/192315/gm1.529_g